MSSEKRSRARLEERRTGTGRPSGTEIVRDLLGRLSMRHASEDELAAFCDDPVLCDAEVVGAAVLFGFGLASRPDLLRRIESGAPIVVVEVPRADWIDPMAKAFDACFASSPPSKGYWRKDRPVIGSGAGPIVVTPGSGSNHPGARGDTRTAQAFREHRPLIGVATPARAELPSDLLRACEERLVVVGFDPEAVELLVEHVVGSTPGRRIAADVASAIEPADIRIAIHPARGADGALDRLEAVVQARVLHRRAADGPRLADLAGYGQAAEWGLAAASDLSAYAKSAVPWSACETAALLVGLPGTGKTSFAHALARQAGVPLIAGSLAQWQSAGEGHLGTTLRAMRHFFDAASKAAPCVALIDELDSFGDRRRFAGHNREYSVQVVNGLLECLDEGGRAGVLLVGTTNDRDRIDPAILRSGRFDRCIAISLPSRSDLAAILRHHLGPDLAGADLDEAAGRAVGGTGADCAAWVRRARSRARRANRALAIEDLLCEIDPSNASPDATDDLRAAVHESGHTVVAHALGFQLRNVVLARAVEGGGTTGLRSPDRYATRENLRQLLAVYLAGRAAEILVFGAPSTGAAADLAEATAICIHMHCSWGLGSRLAALPPASMPKEVSAAVERDLRRASDAATCFLAERRICLDTLASTLTRRRCLDGTEIDAILRPLVASPVPSSIAGDEVGSGGRAQGPKGSRLERGGCPSPRSSTDGGASRCRS